MAISNSPIQITKLGMFNRTKFQTRPSGILKWASNCSTCCSPNEDYTYSNTLSKCFYYQIDPDRI